MFEPDITPPDSSEKPAWWFAFSKGRILVTDNTEIDALIPVGHDFPEPALTVTRKHYIGAWHGKPCYAVEVDDVAELPGHLSFSDLRALFTRTSDTFFAVIGRALQVIAWDVNHQYCGRCATPMEHSPDERSKRCPACGLVNYPRLSPAIIVLVRRDREALLARSARFPGGFFSVLAGFVETGETLEETVKREVKEETNIDVKNVQYFGSQPWPFPDSLMLGFTAEYAGGDIKVDDVEIAEAHWYTVDNLPNHPPPRSIAGQLINWFKENYA
ncbi:MAG: NAD(+) diphosphatase [Pseudomonadota bacterium]